MEITLRIVVTVLQMCLMCGGPIALYWLVKNRAKKSGTELSVGLVVSGVVGFIGSQVVHLPMLKLVDTIVKLPGFPLPPAPYYPLMNGILLGLQAGVCEEIARYLVLRYWQTKARSFQSALEYGTGHGGIESMVFGLGVVVTFVNMIALRGANLSALGLSEEQIHATELQFVQYWSVPFYLPILGGVERLMAMALHLSASALVMQAFLKNKTVYLVLAIAWHAFVDGTIVVIMQTFSLGGGYKGIVLSEVALVILSIVSLLILRWASKTMPLDNSVQNG